jgi:hypothetical protein
MTSPALRPAALAAILLVACAGASAPGPGDPGAEAERHRAALASITVENASPRRLRIAFRPAVGPGADVIVGAVGPDSSALMAPVPAGEPLLLSAVAADSSRFVLPPRSFDLGEHWTWRIPADAVFGAGAARSP